MSSRENVVCIQKKNSLRNKVNCVVYLPFLVLFLFMIFIHFNIDLGWGDDVRFANVFGDAGPSLARRLVLESEISTNKYAGKITHVAIVNGEIPNLHQTYGLLPQELL